MKRTFFSHHFDGEGSDIAVLCSSSVDDLFDLLMRRHAGLLRSFVSGKGGKKHISRFDWTIILSHISICLPFSPLSPASMFHMNWLDWATVVIGCLGNVQPHV